MKILILGEFFSGLTDWHLYGKKPKGMPAVYNFYKILGEKKDVHFEGIVLNKHLTRTITFENGSILHVIKYSRFKNYHFLWKFFGILKTYNIAKKMIKKSNDFDVIYGMANFALLASLLGKRMNIKSVGRVFGTFATELIKNNNLYKLYTRHIVDVLIIKNPPDILISTEDGTDYAYFAKKFNPKKEVKIIFNGMDKDLKNTLLNLTPSKIVITKPIKFIYIARLSPWKRQDLAIKTIYELRQLNIDAFLTIIGDGPELQNIKKLISELKMSNFINIIDSVAQVDLPQIIEKHHISMSLYNNGNLGNVIWETSLAGKITVIRKSGNLHDIFRNHENSVVVENEDDAKTIAFKINESFKNDNINTYGTKIRKEVDNIIMDWEKRINYELEIIL